MGLTTNYGISVLEQRLKEIEVEICNIYDQLACLQSSDTILESEPTTWEDVRAKRDILLAQSDWTMTTGCTVDQREWSQYRQCLRDLPQVFGKASIEQIKWPVAPSTFGPNTSPVE